MAETEDLKSFQCRFESDWGHFMRVRYHLPMRRASIFVLAIATLLIPSTSEAEVPTSPHLSPPAYNAPLIPGYFQLTWVGQWKTPPHPEFTNLASSEIFDSNSPSLNWARAVFPKCSTQITERCISSLEFKSEEDSLWSQAQFLYYLPVTTLPFKTSNRDRYVDWASGDVDSKRDSNWPLDSARSSIWEIKTKSGSKKYLASVSIGYDALFHWYTQFNLNLTPVAEVSVSDASQYSGMDPDETWCARTGYGDSFFQGNNFHPLNRSNPDTGIYDYCLVKTKFDENVSYRINTQLSPSFTEKDLANWVTSRTKDSRVYSKSLGKGKPTLVIFQGYPTAVQAGVTRIPHTLEGFNSWFSGSPHKKAFDEGKYGANWLEDLKRNWGIDTNYSGGESWNGAGWESINQWKTTEKYIDPSLTIEQTLWDFSVIALEDSGDSWVAKCKSKMNSSPSFSGLISTNATVFVQGPPKLESNGKLNFQIASTHFKQNGDVNLGNYNLSISDDVAKCIWGASELGADASISIVDANGEKQIAVTSVGKSDGQVNFSASGFHYSTNSISVSLGSKVLPQVKVADRLTITCVKGKLTKKVTAVSPKCPAGYKKK